MLGTMQTTMAIWILYLGKSFFRTRKFEHGSYINGFLPTDCQLDMYNLSKDRILCTKGPSDQVLMKHLGQMSVTDFSINSALRGCV